MKSVIFLERTKKKINSFVNFNILAENHGAEREINVISVRNYRI